jgi:SAM-dependent methyltransferase
MSFEKNGLLKEVAGYYSSKILKHGDTPQGVDWNGEKGQVTRFFQLCKIISTAQPVSVNDLGCGYGALFEFLQAGHDVLSYQGVDVSEQMISASRARFKNEKRAEFILSDTPDRIADYGLASGVFNVRFKRSDSDWRDYMGGVLDTLDATSRFGFAFNCLTSYSDESHMRKDLYYSNPGEIFDFCKKRYSRNVSLLHDYDLYEFTILVRKL